MKDTTVEFAAKKYKNQESQKYLAIFGIFSPT